MSDAVTTALSTALLVGMGGLIVYQIYMLRWTKRTAGAVPRAVLVLRSINIMLLVMGTGLIVWALAR
ncbi:MAG: hypothetical protein JW733_05710 [Coriobacteriia bacterium]|nr:hypothetical protein [Coriobacteriia bacterium]MBN2840714.1 hypothetical protein [Coriobacteriia bacterium]